MSEDVEIEFWPIKKIKPYAKNAKKHSDEDVDKLVNAMNEFGFTTPIQVDSKGVIIAGHGRRLAAIKRGMKTIPVIVERHLTPDQVKAARLSDNKVSGVDYDVDLEQAELMSLVDTDVNLSATGYSDRELEFMTDELDSMDMGALIDDLDSEVSEQTDRTDKAAAAAGDGEVSVGEAFGFKKVTIDQARVLGKFISKVQSLYPGSGQQALTEFAADILISHE